MQCVPNAWVLVHDNTSEFYIIFSWIIQPQHFTVSFALYIYKSQHFGQNSTLLKPLVLLNLVEIKKYFAPIIFQQRSICQVYQILPQFRETLCGNHHPSVKTSQKTGLLKRERLPLKLHRPQPQQEKRKFSTRPCSTTLLK